MQSNYSQQTHGQCRCSQTIPNRHTDNVDAVKLFPTDTRTMSMQSNYSQQTHGQCRCSQTFPQRRRHAPNAARTSQRGGKEIHTVGRRFPASISAHAPNVINSPAFHTPLKFISEGHPQAFVVTQPQQRQPRLAGRLGGVATCRHWTTIRQSRQI